MSVIKSISAAALAACLWHGVSQAGPTEWPSYNRTLTSERFTPLNTINTRNARKLKVLCSYDTGQMAGFQTGLIEVNGALYATTEHDTFSIDPDSCAENWRAHEDFPSGILQVNRGVAYLDGRVFRGTTDGRVLAYDGATGKRLWATTIADPSKGESVPAAPIAWNGLVFIGNAGGDNKGVKGRMYALDARTGIIIWEFYLVPREATDWPRGPAAPGEPATTRDSWKNAPGFPVSGGGTWASYTLDPVQGLLYVPGGNPSPDFVKDFRDGDNLYTGSIVVLDAKTGAYKKHFQLVRRDFHDWDTSTAPSLFTSQGGRHMMAAAPKDGYLYGFDLTSGKRLYRLPMTTVLNAEAPITEAGTRFCPGSQGGAEWNGPAYYPARNLVYTGEVDWCSTVRSDSRAKLTSVAPGQPWSGSPDGFGKQDDISKWAGWLTANDADTGKRAWRFKALYPLLGGVTPTAGNLLLFGDMGGNFYVLNASNGEKLWSQDLGGAIAGGVISYDTGKGQKIAVAAGMTSPIWPTPKVNGKIVILGIK